MSELGAYTGDDVIITGKEITSDTNRTIAEIPRTPRTFGEQTDHFLSLGSYLILGVVVVYILFRVLRMKYYTRKKETTPKPFRCEICNKSMEHETLASLCVMKASPKQLVVYQGNVCEKCINAKVNTYAQFAGVELVYQKF